MPRLSVDHGQLVQLHFLSWANSIIQHCTVPRSANSPIWSAYRALGTTGGTFPLKKKKAIQWVLKTSDEGVWNSLGCWLNQPTTEHLLLPSSPLFRNCVASRGKFLVGVASIYFENMWAWSQSEGEECSLLLTSAGDQISNRPFWEQIF